jgi:hypothetical protein
MHYEDCEHVIRICRGKNAALIVAVPKDGYSDAYRFRDALQEKIPGTRDDVPLVEVSQITLAGKPLNDACKASFGEAWAKKGRNVTLKVWGNCFQTMAWEHKRKGEFVELDLDAEHYYNVVVSAEEEKEFYEKNPKFAKRGCGKECIKRVLGELGIESHTHFVHGAYDGSKVDGFDCAPPLRLAKKWENGVSPHLRRLGQAKQASHRPSRPAGGIIVNVRGNPWETGRGAQLFAGWVIRRAEVTFAEIRPTLLEPRAAEWACRLPEGEMQKAEEEGRRLRLFNRVWSLGVGASLEQILDTLSKEDRTEDKRASMYTLRHWIVKKLQSAVRTVRPICA